MKIREVDHVNVFQNTKKIPMIEKKKGYNLILKLEQST